MKCVFQRWIAAGVLAAAVTSSTPLMSAFAADLQTETDLALAGAPSELAGLDADVLRDRQVLFAAPTDPEDMPDFFLEAMVTARELGARATTLFHLSSKQDILTSGQQLEVEITNLYYANGQVPIVLIGHSKGGLESLLLSLQRPEIFRYVSHVVTIQSPVRGTDLADAHDTLCLAGALWQSLPITLACMAVRAWRGDSLPYLKTRVTEPLVRGAYEALSPEMREYVSRRIFYVAATLPNGSTYPPRLRKPHWLIQWMLRDEPNETEDDGMVPRHRQYYSDFGTLLGHVRADHGSLITGYAEASQSTVAFREAFARAMYRKLGAAGLSAGGSW